MKQFTVSIVTDDTSIVTVVDALSAVDALDVVAIKHNVPLIKAVSVQAVLTGLGSKYEYGNTQDIND